MLLGRTPLESTLIMMLNESKEPTIDEKTQKALIHRHSCIATVEALLHAGWSCCSLLMKQKNFSIELSELNNEL